MIEGTIPIGMTGNGHCYEVHDGKVMPHDKTMSRPVRITVAPMISAAGRVRPKTQVTWVARYCPRCFVKNTAENDDPCIHQLAAIAKHRELHEDADVEMALERFPHED